MAAKKLNALDTTSKKAKPSLVDDAYKALKTAIRETRCRRAIRLRSRNSPTSWG